MKPQITKFLSGGLNLLPAGDQIPEGQCIAAQNWRSDQAGVLRSRKSNTAAVATPGGNVHTIKSVLRTSGNMRYYGADDKLYAGATLLDSGFDGSPLGVVSFQNQLWVMNRSKQMKHDGTDWRNWTPTAPTAPPTYITPTTEAAPTYVSGGGGTGKLRGPVVYYVTGIVPEVGEVCRSAPMTVASLSGATALPWGSLVPVDPVSGGSIWLGWGDNNSATISAPAFAYPGVTQWNLYRIPPYSGTRTMVAPGQTSAGTPYGLDQVPYRVNVAPIPIASTYLDKAQDLTGTGGDNQDYEYLGTVHNILTFALQGDYKYYVTGATDIGEETDPSPALAIALGTDSIIVTRPAFVDPQITGWNLYRTGGSFPLQPYRVNAEILPLATLTYLDTGKDNRAYAGPNQSDLGIVQLGLLLATDHTPAPPARGLAGPYMGKLLAFNSALHPNRVWWTPADQPSYFPGSNSEQDGNWVDLGEEGEEVIALAIFPRRVVILKSSGYWRMVGDPDDWGSDIERTNAEVGQIGIRAVAIAGAAVFGQASEGLVSFNGDTAEKISLSLDPIFKLDGVTTAGAIPSAPIAGDRAAACMAYRNGRLYFSCSSFTLVSEAGRWFTDHRKFSALYYEGQNGSFLGAYGGAVYELESGSAEADIPLIYQSRFEDQGAPENQKRYSDILIEHNSGGRVFTAYAYLDNGAAKINLGTFQSVARAQTTFILDTTEYRNIAVRLECAVGNAVAEIYTLAAHYLPLERNARTYDSGKVPLEKVSLIGALEIDLEILSGEVNYTFETGIRGLTDLVTGTLPYGLKTFTVALPNGTEARWVRLLLSGSNFRCHGARLHLQPFGCYLAGVGDMFRSGDLTMGSPRMKLFQQIRVDCDPDGSIPGSFFSDTPYALAERQGLRLNETPARGWQRTNFPMNTRGKVCRVELTANAICRLYAIQIRTKVLGEPGAWEWLDVPVPATPPGFSWVPLPIT